MRQTNLFTWTLSALLAGAMCSLSSCEKIKELLEEEKIPTMWSELDFTDSELITDILSDGVWYKAQTEGYVYLMRENGALTSSVFGLWQENPHAAITDQVASWKVEDERLVTSENTQSLDEFFGEGRGFAIPLKRMYNPETQSGTEEVFPLTEDTWRASYMDMADKSRSITLQFKDDGTMSCVDSIFLDPWNVEEIKSYAYRYEIRDNVIHLAGEGGGYGVALPQYPEGLTDGRKAIFLDFGDAASAFTNF